MSRRRRSQSVAGQALSEDRRKHLDLIQQAIARMASASATAKGWLLPVVTAAFGYALIQHAASVALLGAGAATLFGTLDAHYLRQERAFRGLFRAAVAESIPVYEMDNRPYYSKPAGNSEDQRERNCGWRPVTWSWSIAGFYLPIVILGIALAFVAMCAS